MHEMVGIELARYAAAIDAAIALPHDALALRSLSSADLLALNEAHATLTRHLGTAGAVIAGEIGYRSRPELGGQGLARKAGFRTPEILLKNTTGATKRDVARTLAAGTLMVEMADEGSVEPTTGEVREVSRPWLRELAAAVAAGSISTSCADSITRTLGEPNSAVSAEQLATACGRAVQAARMGMDADKLFLFTRTLRDELDVAGVAIREREVYEARGLVHFRKPTGGGRAIWDMDSIQYAKFVAVYDRATSPKLGGVRFVNNETEKAEAIRNDLRTPKQLAGDTFLHLVEAGSDVDPSKMIGSGAPVIRITVAEPVLDEYEATGEVTGFGRIDGTGELLSLGTLGVLRCEATSIRAGFDPNGSVLDVEAEQRLYSKRQREVLAAKFGGCMHPDCDRPPSWTEVHHIQQWSRDKGKTTLANAILWCTYHHLWFHNEGWEVQHHDDGTYWLIPPQDRDPDQTPIHLPLKTKNLEDLWRAVEQQAARVKARDMTKKE